MGRRGHAARRTRALDIPLEMVTDLYGTFRNFFILLKPQQFIYGQSTEHRSGSS